MVWKSVEEPFGQSVWCKAIKPPVNMRPRRSFDHFNPETETVLEVRNKVVNEKRSTRAVEYSILLVNSPKVTKGDEKKVSSK